MGVIYKISNRILYDNKGANLFYYYATPYKGCDKLCMLHLLLSSCFAKH